MDISAVTPGNNTDEQWTKVIQPKKHFIVGY